MDGFFSTEIIEAYNRTINPAETVVFSAHAVLGRRKQPPAVLLPPKQINKHIVNVVLLFFFFLIIFYVHFVLFFRIFRAHAMQRLTCVCKRYFTRSYPSWPALMRKNRPFFAMSSICIMWVSESVPPAKRFSDEEETRSMKFRTPF